jgi:steroid delta-isomerase-like uncharacterized protein
MKRYLFLLLTLIICSTASAQNMSTNKKTVALWYDAFNHHDSALLDKILSDQWVDIPPAPAQPAGPAGAKKILAELSQTFPDLKVAIQDVLEDGNKVIVRSEISGTQKGDFLGFPSKSRKLVIQAIDIHELKDGRIIRTWHSEDWMTGFHQLGIFEK